MSRRTRFGGLFGLLAIAAAALAQNTDPAFDVASIKRVSEVRPGGIAGSGSVALQPGGRLVAPASTVRQLIEVAWELQEIQVLGEPDWAATDRFEVIAQTRAGVTAPEARAMLRTLLATRFTLVGRREQQELPVYVLEQARDDGRLGPQARPSGPECAPVVPPRGVPAPPPPPPPRELADRIVFLNREPLRCNSLAFGMNGVSHWSIREITLDRFAQRLAPLLERPVVDRTGLSGAYDLDMTFAFDAAILAGNNDVPPLRTALQEQLGLRLESSRARVDVLVVESVEPPSEN
jgi:uncharacterized protein (TIGR03435 family)